MSPAQNKEVFGGNQLSTAAWKRIKAIKNGEPCQRVG